MPYAGGVWKKKIILILRGFFSYPCVHTDVHLCLLLLLVYSVFLFHIMYGGCM